MQKRMILIPPWWGWTSLSMGAMLIAAAHRWPLSPNGVAVVVLGAGLFAAGVVLTLHTASDGAWPPPGLPMPHRRYNVHTGRWEAVRRP